MELFTFQFLLFGKHGVLAGLSSIIEYLGELESLVNIHNMILCCVSTYYNITILQWNSLCIKDHLGSSHS